jgi:predicted RNase H-like HicB family nuclease
MNRTVQAFIREGKDGWFVAECLNLPVVTQGHSLDETIAHLREAVELALEGEDPALFGLESNNPPITVTLEVPVHAA